MARSCFFSFHYEPDNWRAAKIRNIGKIVGNAPAKDNDWETVTKGGEAAIERWIAKQMEGRSCTVVLIGSKTAGRKWITHEISKSWNKGMGVVGIHIHKIDDRNNKQSTKGGNPLDHVTFTKTKKKLSTIAKVYDPPGANSAQVYGNIAANISDWVEEAIKIRNAN